MKMSNDKEEIVMQENSKGREKKRLQLQFLNRNLSKPNQLFWAIFHINMC